MEVAYQILAACLALIGLTKAWRILDWAYITPKRLERSLLRQGFNGNPYRLVSGDLKEMSKTIQEAKSMHIGFEDDMKPKVLAYFFKTIQKHGNESFFWMGPTPSIIITEPELVREVLTKTYVYQKRKSPNPLTKLVAQGLHHHEKQKWAKHRKIINPAFHLDKLKLMIPAFYLSCDEVLSNWEKRVGQGGPSEVDVWPDLQILSADAISRTAFGSSYQEGMRVFQLQREQVQNVIQAARSIYIPGWR